MRHAAERSPQRRVAIAELGIETVAFDHQTALLSGGYRPATRHLGLGLGDRACLATASRLGLTADRSWADVSIAGVAVDMIR